MDLQQLLGFKEKNVHILGVSAAEGFAVARFLSGLGFTGLTFHDLLAGDDLRSSFFLSHVSLPRRQREEEFRFLLSLPAAFNTADNYLKGIEDADLIFAGQNWFAHQANDRVRKLREAGVPVRFLIQLYFGLSNARIAAITGTNGKTTVTSLLHHILQTAGVPVLMSGNDRYHPQVLDRVDQLPGSGILVLEVSNRQLMELDRGPWLSIVTNVQPDHIAEHGSFDDYVQTKQKLIRLQGPGDYSLVNADDPVSKTWPPLGRAHRIYYSRSISEKNGAGCMSGGECGIRMDGELHVLFNLSDLKLPGEHNLSNAIAASAAGFLCGARKDLIREAVRSFCGVRNRIQYVGSVKGLPIYDDLASTNPSATAAALNAFPDPVVLIAGGDVKGNETAYTGLAEQITEKTRCLILMGGRVEDILRAFVKDRIPIAHAGSISEAMTLAVQSACPGDKILISPAGAGFYTRYLSQGDGIRSWIRKKNDAREFSD